MTEGILIRDQDEVLNILSNIKELGVKLDLDDFGTGYSSMSYLHQFPFDSLKIDRSFVMNMTRSSGSGTTIVRSIVALGNALSLKVIAEGIENEEQLEILRDVGCSYGQGYLFSRPLSPEVVPIFLASRSPTRNLTSVA